MAELERAVAAGDPLLRVDNVVAGFGSTTVLHGVSLTVREGEIAGVFGLNGAGKSVTMKVVAGMVPPRSGTLHFAGDEVTKLSPEQRVERGMANVPQGRQVFPDLSVEENLRLGAYTLRRRDRKRYKPLLDDVYARFPKLAERRKQMSGTMSGGEQASLAVGRALMSEPRLLLVDEPSAGLAPIIVAELFEILRGVNQTGLTILLVEQNVTFGLKLVDRAHIMQRGRIVYEGEVADLDRERVAGYLGIGRLLGRNLPLEQDAPGAPDSEDRGGGDDGGAGAAGRRKPRAKSSTRSRRAATQGST
ncbi:MAG TPA: ABC transporter ATP-binding protein [Candidatus Dormibacteraeota bacterium]|jgi:branched-chain amino acid transport system ATP-binding protein|nr:ABC transporter ATP-binding protein [Candidatus Dormibacteraeota bacterium]